jgi:hypothetical protein
VDGFLCGIELSGEQYVRGGEVLDGFGVFDNPDGLIRVCDKDGALRFPLGVTDGGAATPAFLDAIGAAQASSLIQPGRGAFFCWADDDPSVARPQPSKKARTILGGLGICGEVFYFPAFRARNVAGLRPKGVFLVLFPSPCGGAKF